jgi:CRISPR-associated protein Cmr5
MKPPVRAWLPCASHKEPAKMTTNQQSPQRTLEQKRAAQAWQFITDIQTENTGLDQKKRYTEEYNSLVRGASADIQLNGLGQTLAFWRAKGKSEHLKLFENVSAWVLAQNKISGATHLLEWIVTKASTDDYRRATSEALAFLTWLKRFSEAAFSSDKKTP